MFDLTGKCALVTGASGGIGGDIARALHAAGATVALSGTREEPLNALASELGDRCYVITANLSDRAAVDTFLADEPYTNAGLYDRIEIHRWRFGGRR